MVWGPRKGRAGCMHEKWSSWQHVNDLPEQAEQVPRYFEVLFVVSWAPSILFVRFVNCCCVNCDVTMTSRDIKMHCYGNRVWVTSHFTLLLQGASKYYIWGLLFFFSKVVCFNIGWTFTWQIMQDEVNSRFVILVIRCLISVISVTWGKITSKINRLQSLWNPRTKCPITGLILVSLIVKDLPYLSTVIMGMKSLYTKLLITKNPGRFSFNLLHKVECCKMIPSFPESWHWYKIFSLFGKKSSIWINR